MQAQSQALRGKKVAVLMTDGVEQVEYLGPRQFLEEQGAQVELLSPKDGEPVIVKNYPNSFTQTQLDALLKQSGIENLILVGFMSHMCVNSTARGAFDMGYRPTVVASATATRALPLKTTGEIVPSAQVHSAALAALSDLPAAVVASSANVPAG